MSKMKVYQTVEDLPRAERPTARNFRDLTGQTFGRLTVLHYAGKSRSGSGYAQWACQCSCKQATLTVVYGTHLCSGVSKSCGCLVGEIARERLTTHGLAGLRPNGKQHYLYTTYRNILNRCSNPDYAEFAYYGGRGIRCEFTSVEEFFGVVLQELGDRPPGHSLDRIDNNLNYCSGNLRWATPKEQSLNRRSNRRVEYQGELMTLMEAAALAGMNYRSVHTRVWKLGWSDYEALYTPVRQKRAQPLAEHQISGDHPC